MRNFAGKVAVITGAASGFGREFARLGATLGMKLVLADVERKALNDIARELAAQGVEVLAERVDVSRGRDMDRLAEHARERFGSVQLLFNNAGVGTGGYVWEHSENDWRWLLGVNLWGVIHGLRCFVPMMVEQGDECHVVNTASAAGLVSTQLMAAYNVSKHGVVTLSETLHQDLRLAGANIGVTLLCPAFVPTGIARSDRNRPRGLDDAAPPTQSALAAQQAMEKATAAGRISAADVAHMTFDAIRERRFYLVTHPKMLASVELRLQDILQQRNPSDPFSFKQDVAAKVP